MLRILIVVGWLSSVAAAETLTAGASGGAALGSMPDAETAGLFVHVDGTVDWHPDPGVALGAQAQLWTLNTTWEDLLARMTLSTEASQNVRMYVRGGAGVALLRSNLDDSSSHAKAGLAYAVGCGLLVAAGRAWNLDIELRYKHFAASAETAPDGFVMKPEITAVGLGVGFDAVVW